MRSVLSKQGGLQFVFEDEQDVSTPSVRQCSTDSTSGYLIQDDRMICAMLYDYRL